MAEVKLLVDRMIRKAPQLTRNMHGRVHRLLERGDQRNYHEWLTIQQHQGQMSHSQVETRWTNFLDQSQEVKRQWANLAREAIGKQTIPWFFGIPNNSCLSTTGVLVPATKRAKRSKAVKSSARLPLSGTDTQACNNSWIDDPHQYIKASELTWEEFLRGYSLPNSHHRVDPLNQQRDV